MPQGQSGGRRNFHPPHPPRFDPRTVQRVASRYADYAIPAHRPDMSFIFKANTRGQPDMNNSILINELLTEIFSSGTKLCSSEL